eukprot:1157302-Pelagomonas_calceolata.AAC.34
MSCGAVPACGDYKGTSERKGEERESIDLRIMPVAVCCLMGQHEVDCDQRKERFTLLYLPAEAA